MTSSSERGPVASVDKAMEILTLLAERANHRRSLAEIAQHLGASKSSTLAILETLRRGGFVVNDGTGARGAPSQYRLGPVLMLLGDVASFQAPVVDLARPVTQALASKTGESVRFSLLRGNSIVGAYRAQGRTDVQFASAIGRAEMLHCTAGGKAILATMTASEVGALLEGLTISARTQKTITKTGELLDELKRTLERGYAIDDEEDIEGVVCVGAAVHDRSGRAIGALSLTRLRTADWEEQVRKLGPLVRGGADEISRQYGFVPVNGG